MSKELVTEKSSPIEKHEPLSLPITLIRRDGGTQPRVAINQTTVEEYASDMKEGASFPPVLLFNDGTQHWLADGFHRVLAAESIGLKEIAAVVRQGTQRDAVLYSCGANATHGLRRTNADKRRAVLRLLEDSEWSKWSNREIAKRCAVSPDLVDRMRKSLPESGSERTYFTKHGTVATMNTAKIGRNPSKPPEELPDRVTVIGNHPASGQSGTITQVPNSYSAIVKLDAVGRELIELKYLVWEGTQIPIRERKDFTSVSGELDDQGKRLGLKYNRTSDQVLPDVERNHRSPADVDDRPGAAPPPPKKVEVNTNDILVAFASNLDYLSNEQLKFVGKAIARQSPERVSEVVEAIGISSEKQAIEIVKAIVLVYPEAIRDLIEEINNDLSMNA